MRRGSISSWLIMYGRGVRSILLLPHVTRCLETIDTCIWHVCVVVTVWCIIIMHLYSANIQLPAQWRLY